MFCKKSFFILMFSTFVSFTAFASNQNFNSGNVEYLSDEVQILHEINPSSDILLKETQSPHPKQSALASSTPVECSQAKLSAAIIAGNNTGSAILQLPANCTYLIQDPDNSQAAFPAITGNITIIGGEGTILKRAPSAALFRIFTVDPSGFLTLRNLSIQGGDTAGQGGGILVNGALVMDKVTLSNNNAANGGALSVSSGASAQVLASIFLSNTTTGVGGGGIINSGELLVKNSYLSGNSAPINGGAINTQATGISTILLSLITSNTAGGLGGALSNLGTINITQSIINYNKGSSGGGLATGNNNITISKTSNTAILNNQPDNCSPLNTLEGCVQ